MSTESDAIDAQGPSRSGSGSLGVGRKPRANTGDFGQEGSPFLVLSAACVASGLLFVVVFVLQGKATLSATTLYLTDRPTKNQFSTEYDGSAAITPPLETMLPFQDGECDNSDCTDLARWLKQWMRRDADPCDNFYEYVCGNMIASGLLSKVAIFMNWELRLIMKFYTSGQTQGTVIDAATLMYKMCEDFAYGAYPEGNYPADATVIKNFMSFLGIDFGQPYANIHDYLLSHMVYLSTKHAVHSVVAFKKRRQYRVPGNKPYDFVVEITPSKMTTAFLLKWKPGHPHYNESWFSGMLKEYTYLPEGYLSAVSSELRAAMDEVSTLYSELNNTSAHRDRIRLMNLSQIVAEDGGCRLRDYWEAAFTNIEGFDPKEQGYLFLTDVQALEIICYFHDDTSSSGIVVKLFAWFVLLELAFPSYYAEPWRRELFGPTSWLLFPHIFCAENVLRGPLGVASIIMMHRSRDTSKSLDAADRIRKDVLSTLTFHLTSHSSMVRQNEQKADLLNITIGFPDRMLEYIDDKLVHFRFNFSAKGYLASLSALHEATDGPLLWLRVTGADRLSQYGATNALYYGPRRQIYLPPGLLVPPLFYADGLPAYNYGVFGNILATEVLGLLGIYSNGTNRHRKPWTEGARNHFRTIIRCLLDQEKKRAPLDRLLWTRQAPEASLVNHVATWLSYKAYQSSLAWQQHRWTLKDLGLTPQQLFFVSHCALSCSSNKGDIAARQRCVQPLVNMPEFAKAFKCGPVDRMFSATKCPFL